MASSDLIDMEGTIVDTYRGGTFKVETDTDPPTEVLCKPAGKLRLHKINLVAGDRVSIQVSPYDLTKGRITRRLKK